MIRQRRLWDLIRGGERIGVEIMHTFNKGARQAALEL
jgi:hypothetical protein